MARRRRSRNPDRSNGYVFGRRRSYPLVRACKRICLEDVRDSGARTAMDLLCEAEQSRVDLADVIGVGCPN